MRDTITFFTTENLSEYRAVQGEGRVKVSRMACLSGRFVPFVTVAALPPLVVGEPFAGSDVDGRPFTTSAITAVEEV